MKHKKVRFVLFIILSLFMLSGNLWAEEAPKLDTGDTAWMLTSTVLVLFVRFHRSLKIFSKSPSDSFSN